MRELGLRLEQDGKGVGPSAVVKALRGEEVRPVGDMRVLMGTNTPAEWKVVLDLLGKVGRGEMPSVEECC